MGDAADAWISALEKRRERKRKEYELGKIAESFIKVEPEALKGLGMSEDEFRVMSARDKSLAVTGLIEAQGFRKGLMQLKELNETVRAGQMQNDAMSAFQKTMSGTNAPADERSIVQEGLKSGLAPRDLSALQGAVEGMGAEAAQPGTVKQVPGLPGYMFGVQNRSGAGSFLPLGGAKKEKPAAPNESWVYTDKPEEFKAELLKIKDPAVRDAVIKARREYSLATKGSEDPMVKLIETLTADKQPKGSGEPKPAKVRKWNPQTKKFE